MTEIKRRPFCRVVVETFKLLGVPYKLKNMLCLEHDAVV